MCFPADQRVAAIMLLFGCFYAGDGWGLAQVNVAVPRGPLAASSTACQTTPTGPAPVARPRSRRCSARPGGHPGGIGTFGLRHALRNCEAHTRHQSDTSGIVTARLAKYSALVTAVTRSLESCQEVPIGCRDSTTMILLS